MLKVGILSDTHLSSGNNEFKNIIEHCFSGCDVIIHAGDLTDISLLDCFPGKIIHAVHGNMCNARTYKKLPATKEFRINGFSFGLTHGAGLGQDIESALWNLFPVADCMIYGHTHRPVCQKTAGRLIINPGSFQPTARYGAPGTYAILTITAELQAAIHTVNLR